MTGKGVSPKRHVVNRRAFLYGAGGVALGLPFLEGLPERSAWAQDAAPIFTFFICAACGVEPKRFWPESDGVLTDILASGDKAVNKLVDHAANLLIVRNVDFPLKNANGCGHAQGLSQALTGKNPTGNGGSATATGPSADFVISKAVNGQGKDPLTLYAGNLNNFYIEERLSFDDSGRVRAAVDNPYKLYEQLVGVAAPAGSSGGTGGTGGTPPPTMAEELLRKRKSVNDLVRAEIRSLIESPKLSAADKLRMQQHFDCIREIENDMMDMGGSLAECSMDGIDSSAMTALKNWRYNATNVPNGGIENIAELHMQLAALAFGCNFNRTGTLQWGDGTDHTIYEVPANMSLGKWNFHHISHRVQSDGNVGQNSGAETAHAEIDVLRMETLARGLNHFRDRGLEDRVAVVWTNHVAIGNHAMSNVPFIIWGNAGGVLKQNALVDAKHANNATLLNVL
ncbi:MAG TPA: DUF1552 domain-containing protein, partial [Polyangiaceae bacterium]